MSFDVKTAFLHARLPYSIYVGQIPGYPEYNPKTVLKLLVTLYGLKQSAYEWYKLLSNVLNLLGLLRCEADHAVFIGRWNTPPHPSIPTLSLGAMLTLIGPVHVDDGLAIFNSLPLYQWFTTEMSKKINFVCMGAVINSQYLGHHIICNRSNKTIRISQADLISDLLEDWRMKTCKPANVPLLNKLHNLPPCSPNACNEISDNDITVSYQQLVRRLTYLAICTHLVMSTPDALPTEIALIALLLFKFQVYSTSLCHYYHRPITLSTFRLLYQSTIHHMASINALQLPLKKFFCP
jgi:Reverse transcriptase (RNA-dependent DNA polymerase)